MLSWRCYKARCMWRRPTRINSFPFTLFPLSNDPDLRAAMFSRKAVNYEALISPSTRVNIQIPRPHRDMHVYDVGRRSAGQGVVQVCSAHDATFALALTRRIGRRRALQERHSRARRNIPYNRSTGRRSQHQQVQQCSPACDLRHFEHRLRELVDVPLP